MTSGSIQIDRSGYITVKPAQMHSIEQVREVTAVLVLFGLPRDLTASILAHEAMHVWMRLTKNIPYPLPLKLEEGMCQVVARGYLEDLTTASHNSDTGEAKGDRAGEEKEGKGQSGPSPATSRGGTSVFATALNRLEYCPVISSTPDQAQISKSKKSRALRAYFSSQIETDCSEVYGAGFREAQECCSALGLEIVLEVIRETSKLPKM